MRGCWTIWYICASFRQVLLLFRAALVMVLICVHENGLNLAFKKLHKEIHAHCDMSNNTEMYKENNGATLYSKILSSGDKHLFRQWVFIKYLLLGLGEIVVNKMDMLSALCDLGGCSDLCFLYIFFLLPHHYLKGRRRDQATHICNLIFSINDRPSPFKSLRTDLNHSF